jgi:hypothetical protein
MLRTVRKQILFNAAEKVSTSKQMLALLQSPTWTNVWLEGMDGSMRLAFLETSVILREVLDERQENQATLRCALGTVLWHRLCDQLPRLLRKESKAAGGTLSHETTIASSHLLVWLRGLASDTSNFVKDERGSSSLGSAVRACLKYGMAESDSQTLAATSAGCLRLVREVLLCIHSASPVSKANLKPPSPEEVFEMMVSHSKFHASMCEPSNFKPNEDRKLEAIRLLLTCISIATTPVTLANHVWDTLFAAHNASISVVDSTLRRLLYVASSQHQKVIFLYCKRRSAISISSQWSAITLFELFRANHYLTLTSIDGKTLRTVQKLNRSTLGTGWSMASNSDVSARRCDSFHWTMLLNLRLLLMSKPHVGRLKTRKVGEATARKFVQNRRP